jgi:hypothetical protein
MKNILFASFLATFALTPASAFAPSAIAKGNTFLQSAVAEATVENATDLSPIETSSPSTPFPKAVEAYPGALTNNELVHMIARTLDGAGYTREKTLVATSLCCDEVNRPLEKDLSGVYTNNFWMGGLAGFPFGGAVAFGAMAAHIPDDGSCLMVYGPHVGVDTEGNVGTVERRGLTNGGSCCGSAENASGYVADVFAGTDKKVEIPDDPISFQQSYVRDILIPYGQRLNDAENRSAELPLALYDAQTDVIDAIISKSAGGVAGDGKIAVLGGVQINTPKEFSDYYLPLTFKLYNNKGEELEVFLDNTKTKEEEIVMEEPEPEPEPVIIEEPKEKKVVPLSQRFRAVG